MKKILALSLVCSMFVYGGCIRDNNQPSSNLKVVTSFYPLYEIAREVGGQNVSIRNMVPVGVEPHDYEPTSGDIVALHEADLVLYNGAGIEPWSDKIIPELETKAIPTMNMSELLKSTMIKNEQQEIESNEYLSYDPHIWMDPLNYQKEIELISQKFIELDPEHQNDYKQNTQNFLKQIEELHAAYSSGLQNCKLNTFITNHAAFAYLANRYHLNMIPVSGLSPDAEPSPKVMADIVQLIRQKNIHFILTESLVSPKTAETLASETGATTLILNPLEGLTPEEIAQGKNYVSVMKENLKNLKTALECNA